MAQFVVRQLEDDVAEKLKRRAKRHARSMEDEVRHILRTAVREHPGSVQKLGTRIAQRFKRVGLGRDLPELRGVAAKAAAFRFVIILDTNVLSALMRTNPDAVVVAWLDRQPADSVWLTSITVFEARFGLALLPKSRRRSGLERALDRVLTEDLSNRVIDFDSIAAATAAQLAADRQRAGRVADLRDTMIAGIAQARRATVATRNTRHFRGLDVPVVDPWSS